MKPVKTPDTQFDYKGPTPDIGDLPCYRVRPGFILSEWELTKAERIAIARGARIELGIHTEPIPPVSLHVVQRDAEGALSYVDEHGPWEAITPEELAGRRAATPDPNRKPSRRAKLYGRARANRWPLWIAWLLATGSSRRTVRELMQLRRSGVDV